MYFILTSYSLKGLKWHPPTLYFNSYKVYHRRLYLELHSFTSSLLVNFIKSTIKPSVSIYTCLAIIPNYCRRTGYILLQFKPNRSPQIEPKLYITIIPNFRSNLPFSIQCLHPHCHHHFHPPGP